MQPTIHFYDAQCIGTPAHGQVVAFDSILCGSQESVRFMSSISLRPDVSFNPLSVEASDTFDLDLSSGVTEYEWSRKAQDLFARPGTLHVGLGNTSSIDHFIRYALYRCLSALPNTELSTGAHYLDLLTICRAISLLRPESLPVALMPEWTEQRKRNFVMAQWGGESRAEVVSSLAKLLSNANPKLMAHAISHSSPRPITDLCGLVDGRLEGLDSLRPVFVCHESLMVEKKHGVFLALGTDPQYKNILYLIDLESDLRALVDDAGVSVSRFIRTEQSQADRPVLRVNLNRIPFVGPASVIDAATALRLGIDMQLVRDNASLLRAQPDVCLSLMEVSGASEAAANGDADFQLYGAEYLAPDMALLARLHEKCPSEWSALLDTAHDARITELGMRLIRRFDPALLSDSDAKSWHAHCASRLLGRSDPARFADIKVYCENIAGSHEYPKGMRTAAQHWLHTTENGNEPRSNI
ncbi:hypothetical protein ACI77O_13030 [Pseudomonas tritici]|uniref:hypothetical protein n=1 Tax=Pseudomonas tritici TaxID=2745518 RepID=UPI00387AF09A